MKTARKLGLLSTLYFSQGLPFGFFTQALPVLMREGGHSLRDIGFSHLLALPWALKFLWAPCVDRGAGNRLGRRRGFIVPLQLASAGLLAMLSFIEPAAGLAPVLAAVLLANLMAATQDVATDGLAVDLLAHEERGLGNGVQVAGYRVGMIVGGGALLIAFERLGWASTFLSMAALLLVATIPIVLFREHRAVAPELERAGERASLGGFLRRPGIGAWLALLFFFKFGEALAGGMFRPFLVDLGWKMSDVGELLGTVGFVAGMLGALAGGWLTSRIGRRAALLAFGILQAVSNAGYAWAALQPAKGLLYAASTVEHFTGGMATAALFTAMMDACRREAGATDYTAQASVVVVATGLAATLSGVSAELLGYAGHFAFGAALCLVGVAFVWRYARFGGDGVPLVLRGG
ncbi:MAG: MFS transporter [Myxococcales bacterium]